MFETAFSHGIIESTIITFGALFSNVKIQRLKSDKTVGQLIACPIVYGPKEKILVRLRQDPSLDNQVMITLPRMSFEITDYTYDPSRAQNRNNKVKCYNVDGSVSGTFMPVPYNLGITLSILTKGSRDSLDIIEQILPIFMPEYTAAVKSVPSLNITQDIPFVLNSVSSIDDYEGGFEQARLVTHTLSFTAKLYLYGIVGNANVITRTDTALLNIDGTETLKTHTSTGNITTGEITSDFWS
jgi:hypothetical protein